MSFFVKEVLNEESGNYFELTGMGYGALVAIMIGILLAACFVSGRKEEEKSGVRQLIFSSMAMALAMVTSMIKSLTCLWAEALRCSVCFSSALSAIGTV